MLLIVLMADMPSAPPRRAASAAGLMRSTLGVSFARIGIFAPRLAAAVNRSTSSGTWPISDPRPPSAILGQEKFSSMASAPFSSHRRASRSQSSSSSPMMDARMNLVGYFALSRRKISIFSSTLWSDSCSIFLKPMILPLSPVIAEKRGEASWISMAQMVLKETPAQPASKALAHIS